MKCKFLEKNGELCQKNTDSKWELCEAHFRQISDFQKKVAQILKRPGVKLTFTNLYHPPHIQLLATLHLATIPTHILIECWEKEERIDRKQLALFYGIFKAHPNLHRAILISNVPYQKEALELAHQLPDLDALTLEDLMGNLLDFHDYLRSMVGYLNSLQLQTNFLPRSGQTTQGTQVRDVESHLENWVEEKETPFLFLLGTCGEGKTTLAQRFVLHQAQKVLEHKSKKVPLLLPLTSVPNLENLPNFLTSTLTELYHLSIESYKVLERVMELGNLVFVFDGFGEYLQPISSKALEYTLQHLLQHKWGQSKILITAEKNVFFTQNHTPTSLLQQIPTPKAQILQLSPLEKKEINLYLTTALGGEIDPAIQNAIFGQGTLRQLAQQPFWLYITSNIHPKERTKLVNDANGSYALYFYAYTLLNQPNEQWPPPQDRENFIYQLAYYMTLQNKTHLSKEELSSPLLEALTAWNNFDSFLHNCPFLRKTRGKLHFSHKIFVDYFAARWIASNLQHKNFQTLELFPLTYPIAEFIQENLSLEDLAYLQENVFSQTMGFAAKNALLILYIAGKSLDNLSLENARLDDIKLPNASLKKANLQGASLRNANLTSANLSFANLQGADLQNANLTKAILYGAKLEKANLQGTQLEGANLEGANLTDAQLDRPQEDYIRLGAIFRQRSS